MHALIAEEPFSAEHATRMIKMSAILVRITATTITTTASILVQVSTMEMMLITLANTVM